LIAFCDFAYKGRQCQTQNYNKSREYVRCSQNIAQGGPHAAPLDDDLGRAGAGGYHGHFVERSQFLYHLRRGAALDEHFDLGEQVVALSANDDELRGGFREKERLPFLSAILRTI
jgi:hypothetical protein